MLLQIPFSGGLVLVVFLSIALLIGIPTLATLLMRLYVKVAGKKVKTHYKEFIPFLSILLFSAIALLLIIYMLMILFKSVYPFY
jgi:hypothetical protein